MPGESKRSERVKKILDALKELVTLHVVTVQGTPVHRPWFPRQGLPQPADLSPVMRPHVGRDEHRLFGGAFEDCNAPTAVKNAA